MDLSGQQIRMLREGLQAAFLDFNTLSMFLAEQVERQIANYASPFDPLPTVIFRLIQAAQAEGWLGDLVVAAHSTRPRQHKIASVATELGFTGLGPNLTNRRIIGAPVASSAASQLESIVRDRERFIDVEGFIARATTVQSQVCRIEVTRKNGNGTGFLVGSDLVLTNYHVMEPVFRSQALATDVVCRFDYRKTPHGETVRPGTPFKLKQGEWEIDKSPYSQKDLVEGRGDPSPDELDYCLLRLKEPAGEGKAGGSQDTNAERRGWVTTNKNSGAGAAGDDVFLFQHPKGRPLVVAVGEHLGFNGAGNRMRYDADTLGGSSGSPVFNADLELIGLHHRGDPAADVVKMTAEHNQGIPVSRILTLLEARGVEAFWVD